MDKRIEDMLFSFEMCRGKPIGSYKRRMAFGNWSFCCDENTPLSSACLGHRELMLFGLVTDVRNTAIKDLPMTILENTSTLNDVIAYEWYLGGKYLLFYRQGEQVFVIPDATASIPAYYSVQGNEMRVTAFMHDIVKALELSPDAYLSGIRKKSDISQAMPYDLTCYKEIRQLLPNHVLFCEEQCTYRFVNAAQKQQCISAQEVADITAPFIRNILDFYQSRYKIYCPITAGRDSRVVLSFLRAGNKGELHGYTIRHGNHSDSEQDLVIPQTIAEHCGFRYEQIQDEAPSAALKSYFDRVFGEGMYSSRTLMIANTIYNHYNDGAIINGDIIGQVGKCSLHRDIPEFLATPGYFRCKLHNYSHEAKKVLKDWMRDIESSGEQVNLFDLFSMENRMGRWAAQSSAIYNTMGQLNLNIFNSRCIVYEWTKVDRAERAKGGIHQEILQKTDPIMLEFPFETDGNFLIKLSKGNGKLFYIASICKYLAEKTVFSLRHRK